MQHAQAWIVEGNRTIPGDHIHPAAGQHLAQFGVAQGVLHGRKPQSMEIEQGQIEAREGPPGQQSQPLAGQIRPMAQRTAGAHQELGSGIGAAAQLPHQAIATPLLERQGPQARGQEGHVPVAGAQTQSRLLRAEDRLQLHLATAGDRQQLPQLELLGSGEHRAHRLGICPIGADQTDRQMPPLTAEGDVRERLSCTGGKEQQRQQRQPAVHSPWPFRSLSICIEIARLCFIRSKLRASRPISSRRSRSSKSTVTGVTLASSALRLMSRIGLRIS